MIINAEKFTPEFVPPPPRYIVTLNFNQAELDQFRIMVGCSHSVAKIVYSNTNSKSYNELRTMLAQMYDTVCDFDLK